MHVGAPRMGLAPMVVTFLAACRYPDCPSPPNVHIDELLTHAELDTAGIDSGGIADWSCESLCMTMADADRRSQSAWRVDSCSLTADPSGAVRIQCVAEMSWFCK